MFHIVSLNGVDSGNAVTLLYLPSFQPEVWLAEMVVVWTGADWMVGAAEVVSPAIWAFFLLSSGAEKSTSLILFSLSAYRGATSYLVLNT